MPNWTDNHVSFEGSKEKIKELKEFFASDKQVFDFNKIVPMPEDSKDFKAKGGLSGEEIFDKAKSDNWYVWSIVNWGTKWNAVDPQLDVDKDERIEYSFSTAWDAPRGVIDKIYKNGILKDCTDVRWECHHEFEEDSEVILSTNKSVKT